MGMSYKEGTKDAASPSDTTKRSVSWEGAGMGGLGGGWSGHEEGLGPVQEKGSPVQSA